MILDLRIVRETKVVGITTTGAARLKKLIQALRPPIVIVEEAAEVLESHIVVSLTRHCKHLILIGDHQQLRPSAAHFKLAKKYNIEVSLFERMITNGIHSRRLGVQHRMRPEIAALISPSIYPNLENHCSVENFPNVRGMTSNLFFLTHNHREEFIDETSSRSNHYEADMIMSLANYLMQQGYKGEDITILAAYSGQMFYMRNKRTNYDHLEKVKITVVDNYQGEESKIILLSLVRNNEEGKIGFLSIDNRVCVALSRAREGFYIMGNMDMLKDKSELWKKIAASLEEKESLGNFLTLRCENHPNKTTKISCPDDFNTVPQGGCAVKCEKNLKCGHQCPLPCHGYDLGHTDIKCHKDCERILCELEHVCPLKCSAVCKPCKVLVEKELPCGHLRHIFCYLKPEDKSVKCLTLLDVTLPLCGHQVKRACYLSIDLVSCTEPCPAQLQCGHSCSYKCHKGVDADHVGKFACQAPCVKPKEGNSANLTDHLCTKKCFEKWDQCRVEVMKKRTACTHRVRVPCSVDADSVQCKNNCVRLLPCGHHCKMKCSEPCGNCLQKVKKVIADCGHEAEVLCCEDATRKDCKKACERVLPCGHKCGLPCMQNCNEYLCKEIIDDATLLSLCDHKVAVPCHLYGQDLKDNRGLLKYCKVVCDKTLGCGHVCSGTCGDCFQGRLHVPCTQPCRRSLICGHQCKEPCSELCPPCSQQCELSCAHFRCSRLCSEPCSRCREPCSRTCAHSACRGQCGEPCMRSACDEACPLLLPCGHSCRGLCGEPCPNICNHCRPDQFPKNLFGDYFGDNAKFIKLQDCSHVMELGSMDAMMKGESECIKIKKCPYCCKPVINTYRYKDIVNALFKNDIVPIKIKVYGNREKISQKKDQLKAKLIFYSLLVIGNNAPSWQKAYTKVSKLLQNKQTRVSLLHLETIAVVLDFLATIAHYYEKYEDGLLLDLKEEFLEQIKIVCGSGIYNMQKIGQQEHEDFDKEFKRTHCIIQLSELMSSIAESGNESPSEITSLIEKCRACILTWNIFKEDEAIVALKELQTALKVKEIVSEKERTYILNLTTGHWYKCSNGHLNCIMESMKEGQCNECGAAMGVTGYKMVVANNHAVKMDSSRFAAWPENN